ncbi:MAG: Spy/CpxP family protein refolding chaperone [Bacteroidales bacterium]|nr:Spy/CpxP family protein refolding chaperone [Bacteroidales bacterium]
MKTQNLSKLLPAIVLAIVILFTTDAFAQRGRGYRGQGACRAFEEMPDRAAQNQGFCINLPGLTEEQSEKMDALRLKNIKENQELRNQLGEKQAQLRTLKTADQPDMNAINNTIDEMAVLRGGMHKNQAATHQEIRKLLTEEQKILFDSRGPVRRGFASADMGEPRGKGRGYRADCPYRK